MINRRQLLAGLSASAGMSVIPAPVLAAQPSGFRQLAARPADKVLYPETGKPSKLWLYDGLSPGPEIRVRRGERVKVRLANQLPDPTSIHWHGIRIDNAMDGVAGLTQAAVAPGNTFDYDFIAPDAGTYWYHAHNKSWDQVARGLYGPLIVEEDTPLFDRAHDLTLLIDDWRLDGDGVLDTASLGSLMDWSHAGRLGNWLTVNGTSLPDFTLEAGETYRLRLINACNARILEIMTGSQPFEVIALDGQPVSTPFSPEGDLLNLGPAQRADLLVRPMADTPFDLQEVSGQSPFAFARFQVSDGTDAAEPDEVRLPENDLPVPDLTSALNIDLDMTGGAMGRMGPMVHNGEELTREKMRETGQVWAFNGIANRAEKPFFSVSKGQSVVLETTNNTAFPHAIHTHGHHFQILARNGATPSEGQHWRDTFLIAPQERVRIAFVADNPGKWLLHCHMLEHAAAGMNTWFEVT